MSLPFEPACLPLLLGGLPHRNAAQALDLSRRYAGAVLAWPQLPQRSFREQSFVQSILGFPGLVIDAAQARVYIDRQRAERNLADTEYLAREVVALRLAMRDVATKDFIRAELRALLEELEAEVDKK